MSEGKILVVEDDTSVRNLITTTLQMHGYAYETAGNGQSALLLATSGNPDIIFMDLGLPDLDGIDIIRKIRTWSNVPIIVISARSEDADKIAALDAGADDYLTKPFSVEELLARLRVTLRRLKYIRTLTSEQAPVFENAGLKVDYAAGCVTVEGAEVHLTPIEYKLLTLLTQNVGKVLTYGFLTMDVWGNTWDSSMSSLRVYMAGLRKKLGPGPDSQAYIQTHVGIGYRMLRF